MQIDSSGDYYSIGCLFAEKNFWLALDEEKYGSRIDEKIIHRYRFENNKQKWAVMSRPFAFVYNNHRIINNDLIKPFCELLADYFSDNGFIADRIKLNKKFETAIQNQCQKINDDITFTKDKLYNFLKNIEFV